jgi:hypothetical protein
MKNVTSIPVPVIKRSLENPDVDGRIILELIPEKKFGDMDWIHLAQDRN